MILHLTTIRYCKETLISLNNEIISTEYTITLRPMLGSACLSVIAHRPSFLQLYPKYILFILTAEQSEGHK